MQLHQLEFKQEKKLTGHLGHSSRRDGRSNEQCHCVSVQYARTKPNCFYLCLTDAATGDIASPAASKEGLQSKGGSGKPGTIPLPAGQQPSCCLQVLLLVAAEWCWQPHVLNLCLPETEAASPLGTWQAEVSSFPEQTSWDTAPRSGATRMLQLHIPTFKQEKLKQRARAGFL